MYALPQSGEILVDSLTRDTPLVAALLALWLVGFGGAVIGLLVSTLSSSERAAIAILPLLLLPQALVSRVGYGQGGNSWMDRPTPFGPIAELSADCRKLNLQETCLLAASMIMISRPGTAAIDLLQYGGPAKSARHAVSGLDLVGEWIYLILLLLLHVLVLVVVFCRAQGRWKLSPR